MTWKAPADTLHRSAGRRPLGNVILRLGGAVCCAVPKANYGICLGALLPLHNVEFNFIAFFQRFVPIQLDCRVVDEYIWSVFTSDESVALGVVEPLDLSFVLSHRFLPSFCCRKGMVSCEGNLTPYLL